MTHDVVIRHPCGGITTQCAPNREIQIARLTAFLATDPGAYVTHDLGRGDGWHAKLTSLNPAIVVKASTPLRTLSTIGVIRGALQSPTASSANAAIAELVSALHEIVPILDFAQIAHLRNNPEDVVTDGERTLLKSTMARRLTALDQSADDRVRALLREINQ